MRINKGVEWAAHACSLLAPLWPDNGLALASLAEFHDLPEPYMAKQMQALSRAGLVEGGRGRSGFYRLAKEPSDISLLDIYLAIEGDDPMFRCMEIRQQGPCASRREDCKAPCTIAAGFYRAERAFRETLSQIDLVSLNEQVLGQLAPGKLEQAGEWMKSNARTRV